jgi:hypothetical protein
MTDKPHLNTDELMSAYRSLELRYLDISPETALNTRYIRWALEKYAIARRTLRGQQTRQVAP